MFDFDDLREILGTIKKNKLRTFLTGFSVAWGIFMLIVLLGAGNGMRNGVMKNMERWAENRYEMWGGNTTMAYKGMQPNRRIKFKNEDYTLILRDNPEIALSSPIIYHSDTLSYGNEYNSYQLQAVFPDKSNIDKIKMTAGDGRFINNIDINMRRKVIVLSPRMQQVLFKGKSALGKSVNVGSVSFQVVGIYTDENNDNNAPAYIPFSTGQNLYNGGEGIDNIIFTVSGIGNEKEADAFEQRIRTQFGKRHFFNPEDKRAIGMWNTLEDYAMMNGLMNGIALFIWIVGIGTLTAGIVGVSNIMLITVRERTREFGIRKALGATPISILRLIIIESILITAIFGYVGMVAGIGLTELVNYVMESMGAGKSNGNDDMSIFLNPTVNLGVAMSATVLIVAAGVIAGYYPARKAVKITAIEAMRTE